MNEIEQIREQARVRRTCVLGGPTLHEQTRAALEQAEAALDETLAIVEVLRNGQHILARASDIIAAERDQARADVRALREVHFDKNGKLLMRWSKLERILEATDRPEYRDNS